MVMLTPHLSTGYAKLSASLKSANEFKMSNRYLRKAVLLAPEDAVLHNNLGISLYDLDRFDEAIEWFSSALKIIAKSDTLTCC